MLQKGIIKYSDRPSDDEYRPLTNAIQKYSWVNLLSRLAIPTAWLFLDRKKVGAKIGMRQRTLQVGGQW